MKHTRNGASQLHTKFGNYSNPSICNFHTKVSRLLGNQNLLRFHKTQDVPLTPRQLKIRDKFRTIAGTLIYVSITVRPDITTVLNRACQGMANPTRQHIILPGTHTRVPRVQSRSRSGLQCRWIPTPLGNCRCSRRQVQGSQALTQLALPRIQ